MTAADQATDKRADGVLSVGNLSVSDKKGVHAASAGNDIPQSRFEVQASLRALMET